MQPLTDPDFAALLDRLGPFEARPVVAVAVSGGADSLALAWLARRWAAERGGRAVGLTVDHRLRPESTAEAGQVAAWLRRWDMEHHILTWTGDKPAAGLQAAARAARYALLDDWCARHGVLHLLLAHHRRDQAETVLLRQERGSGADGLAAMPAVSESAAARRLRPLLDVPPERLRDTLRLLGQPWLDDPSNRNTAFARIRLRRALSAGDEARLATQATAQGLARTVAEAELSRRAARHVALHASGWAEADAAILDAADDMAARLLARLLMVVAGRAYPPRRERLARLLEALRRGDGGHGLAGVLVRRAGGRLRLLREPAAVAPPLPLAGPVLWDGRWAAAPAGAPLPGMTIGALGDALPEEARALARGLPAVVRATIPSVWCEGILLAVPHLRYNRNGEPPLRFLAWRPPVPMTAVGHCLV